MKEIITIRMLPEGYGYVCHNEKYDSLDELVSELRIKYPGCSFRVVDADIQTIEQWRSRKAA